ncbi:MAG: Fe-S cluster assembly protein SufD [Brevundimonas sp.]
MNAPVRIDLKDVSSFPSKRVEAWKYTDLRRFLRETPPVSPAATVTLGGPFAALGGDELMFANGLTSSGKTAGGFHLGLDETAVLRLRFVSDATSTGHQAFATIGVMEDAELLILESYEGKGSAYVSNVALGLEVESGASVTRVVLVDDAADAISISTAKVGLAPGARFNQIVVTSGAKLQRMETRVRHRGLDARAQLDGLYLLSGSRHADLTSVVDHAGPNGQTSQLTKGVVRDTARGVFQGKIVVERGADGTDARMGHHALILGERAEVDAKPELEIYADDVQCAHGNTVGNLDESALFYMQQRGIPADEARALLTQAFLVEVVDRIEHEGAREVVREWLTARL